MRTLFDLSKLRESRFGQPHPRHGLNLLWWFADTCVQIEENHPLIARCNPAVGDFGFRLFHNADHLLPYSEFPYYEVGNLNNGCFLPHYVTENYTGDLDDSNTDRIIVSLHFSWKRLYFGNVYVTQHSDQVHFDQNRTFCISHSLIKDIKLLNRAEFLRQTKNDQNTNLNFYLQHSYKHSQFPSSTQSMLSTRYQSPTTDMQTNLNSHRSAADDDCCAKCCRAVLMCLLVALSAAFFVLAAFYKIN
ncbi:uncharacterized protein LOC127652173 isoform X3 [Xyrauchen texanus]|nr:uncharacterized protein LOC127652173 isoform X3 [Xyrauchen texanus]